MSAARCHRCTGTGRAWRVPFGAPGERVASPCPACDGTGRAHARGSAPGLRAALEELLEELAGLPVAELAALSVPTLEALEAHLLGSQPPHVLAMATASAGTPGGPVLPPALERVRAALIVARRVEELELLPVSSRGSATRNPASDAEHPAPGSTRGGYPGNGETGGAR